MWNEMKPFVLCAATLALTAGCTHTTATTVVPPAPAAESAATPAAAGFNKGKVEEVIQAGRYSYINVDSGSAKTWFAVPSAEVKVGQQVTVKPGMEVKNFLAKSLNRTFESIYFSDELITTTEAKSGVNLPASHGAVGKLAYPGVKKTVNGKVTEAVPGGDFDFFFVEGGAGKTWVAVPLGSGVTVGETFTFLPGDEIVGFSSGKANRTFDRIVFSSGVVKKSK